MDPGYDPAAHRQGPDEFAADPDPIGYFARPPGSDAGSAAALQPRHRSGRPRRRSRPLRERLEPSGRGIPEARRTGTSLRRKMLHYGEGDFSHEAVVDR